MEILVDSRTGQEVGDISITTFRQVKEKAGLIVASPFRVSGEAIPSPAVDETTKKKIKDIYLHRFPECSALRRTASKLHHNVQKFGGRGLSGLEVPAPSRAVEVCVRILFKAPRSMPVNPDWGDSQAELHWIFPE